MASSISQSPQSLSVGDGFVTMSAIEAILKGCLESDVELSTVFTTAGSWPGVLLHRAELDDARELLGEHGIQVRSSVDAHRGVQLATHAARAGRSAGVLIPASEMNLAAPGIEAARERPFAPGAGMIIIAEDDPQRYRWPSPRRVLASMDIACLEIIDVEHLKDAIEVGLQLSRAGAAPVAAILHATILRSIDTIRVRPNRVTALADVEAHLARRRRRRLRITDDDTTLRVARRLECNRVRNLPSPGERAPAGFVVVGPVAASVRHVFRVMELASRVPILELHLAHPVDEPVVVRFLDRCAHILVLESRPGETSDAILAVAERARRAGGQPGQVWGRSLPPAGDGGSLRPLEPDELILPSVLARRLRHVLERARPVGLPVLRWPDVPEGPQALPAPRDEAVVVLRDMLGDVDRWLRDRAFRHDPEKPPRALRIEGVGREARDVFECECWEEREFLTFGRNAVRHAARDDARRLILVSVPRAAVTAAVRLIESSLTPDGARRIRIEAPQRSDPVSVRILLREIVVGDTSAVVVVARDELLRANEWQADPTEETIADLDRQGFRRRQRAILRADAACDVRGRASDSPTSARTFGAVQRTASYAVDQLTSRQRGGVRVRIRPMLELIELVRTRPPGLPTADAEVRLPLPTILHAREPIWRAHIAPTRGPAPGLAALALIEAARVQGYHVRASFAPSPTMGSDEFGPWAQVVFSQIRDDGTPLPLTTRIPFGDADLLLTMDVHSAALACGVHRLGNPDRTCYVGSRTRSLEHGESDVDADRETVDESVSDIHRCVDDYAEVARSRFGTARPADLVMLGAAYQAGFIPLPIDAMLAGLARLEERGFGRVAEAFRAGRVHQWRSQNEVDRRAAEVETLERAIRRAGHYLRRERATRREAPALEAALRTAMSQMPGLSETEHGRTVQRQIIRAIERLARWGDRQLATTFLDLITALYIADRGEHGRRLTRYAVLPLAEAFLVRDAAYVARMMTSMPVRHALRERFDTRSGRGDVIRRRVLTRLEIFLLRYRLRIDFQAGDWVSRLIGRIAAWRPTKWRGTSADRERRDTVAELIRRATAEARTDYDAWVVRLRALHDLAFDGAITNLSGARIAEAVKPPDGASPVQPMPVPEHDENEETGVTIAQG